MRSFTAGLLVWVALLGLWFFFIFQFSISELVVGAAASSITLFALHRSLCAAPIAADLQPTWLATICSVPGMTGEGLRMLVAALARHLRGEPSRSVWQDIPFHPAGSDREKAGRRALATLFTTFAPNSYVVGIDTQKNAMLVHSLEDTPVPKMIRDLESSGPSKT